MNKRYWWLVRLIDADTIRCVYCESPGMFNKSLSIRGKQRHKLKLELARGPFERYNDMAIAADHWFRIRGREPYDT